ncbi:MAG: EAL domain-containing protein [Synechococcaceae cyanobacterium SM2_3_1]|nr:EAL domain-containing protein [Synechococcaceae cyanobacterium SM2_3_1]
MPGYDFPHFSISNVSLAMNRRCSRVKKHSRSPHPHSGVAIFSAANSAAPTSKQNGHSPVSPLGTTTFVDDDNLMQELATAIDLGELELHYQPIVCLRSHRLIGFEALTRWFHPHWGWVAPSQFIRLAEETGLIHPLGEWVLRTACLQLNQWQQQGRNLDLKMSINLSVKQVEYLEFAQLIHTVLNETGCQAQNLCFEITESQRTEDDLIALSNISHLKSLGAEIHLDDFGNGYSNLIRLTQLPIDTLKIGRAFVHCREWEIISFMVNLAERLGLNLIVEGIETSQELEQIKALGCQLAQGFFFSPALPAEQATHLVDDQAYTLNVFE